MPISWLDALKVVPWRNVIDAAPGLAQSARGFFKRTQDAVLDADGGPPSTQPLDDGGIDATALTALNHRVTTLESGLGRATELQHTTAQLLDSLASQNARLVEVIDALQKRCRLLTVAVVIALGGLIALWVWAVARFS